MGVYVRKDSKFYWLRLERGNGQRSLREPTRIPVEVDRSIAERRYRDRMIELLDRTAVIPEEDSNSAGKARADGSGWCYIYFVTDGELIKIGRAVDVLARVRAMQTGSQRPLCVLATCTAHISLERRLHLHFKASHQGREWFSPDPPLLDLIKRIRDGENPVMELVNSALKSIPPEFE